MTSTSMQVIQELARDPRLCRCQRWFLKCCSGSLQDGTHRRRRARPAHQGSADVVDLYGLEPGPPQPEPTPKAGREHSHGSLIELVLLANAICSVQIGEMRHTVALHRRDTLPPTSILCELEVLN